MERKLLILPLLLFLSACSIPMPGGSNNNNNNDEGEQGQGANMLHGQGTPSASLGNDFDHYYDDDSHYVYEKNNGVWINQFTKGSSALYSTKTSKVAKRDNLDNLKSALATSFYSTNMTAFMKPHFEDGSLGWSIQLEINGQNLKISDVDGSARLENPYYIKMRDDGLIDLYSDGQYKTVNEYHANIYCIVPHPTLENITYSNYLLIDDDEGQMTSIVCANIDKTTYDETTGYYELTNLVASHKELISHYISTPKADNLRFNFKFKLSQDQSYVESAFLDFISSEFYNDLGNLTIEYSFSNMHSTVVDMPE